MFLCLSDSVSKISQKRVDIDELDAGTGLLSAISYALQRGILLCPG